MTENILYFVTMLLVIALAGLTIFHIVRTKDLKLRLVIAQSSVRVESKPVKDDMFRRSFYEAKDTVDLLVEVSPNVQQVIADYEEIPVEDLYDPDYGHLKVGTSTIREALEAAKKYRKGAKAAETLWHE